MKGFLGVLCVSAVELGFDLVCGGSAFRCRIFGLA